MRRTLLALAAVAMIATTGCTGAQIQAVENDVHQGAVIATNAVIAVENNEGSIEAAIAAMSTLAAHSATIAKAQADAQTALDAYKNNKGSIDDVLKAIAVVEKLSAPQESKPPVQKAVRKKTAPK